MRDKMRPYTLYLPTSLVEQYKERAQQTKQTAANLMRAKLAQADVTQLVDYDDGAPTYEALKIKCEQMEQVILRFLGDCNDLELDASHATGSLL